MLVRVGSRSLANPELVKILPETGMEKKQKDKMKPINEPGVLLFMSFGPLITKVIEKLLLKNTVAVRNAVGSGN